MFAASIKAALLLALISQSTANNLRRRPLAMELVDSEPPKAVDAPVPAANKAIPTSATNPPETLVLADSSAPKPNVVTPEILAKAADAPKPVAPAPEPAPVAPATPETPVATAPAAAASAPVVAPASSAPAATQNPELAAWTAQVAAKSTDEKLLVMFELIGKLSVVEKMFDVNHDGRVDATDLINMAKHGNAPSVRRLAMELADSAPPKPVADIPATPDVAAAPAAPAASPVAVAAAPAPAAAAAAASPPAASAAPPLAAATNAAAPAAPVSKAPAIGITEDSWTKDIRAKSTDEKLLGMFELVDKLSTVHDLFDVDKDGTVTKADLLAVSKSDASASVQL